METGDEQLLVERRDSNLWITVNRPAKANSLTVQLMERIASAMRAGAEDPAVRAVLLTGSGDRIFSAGVDVREQAQDGNAVRHREQRSAAHAALQDAVMNTPKPVVAVLNGTAIGGGAMLALLADACVAVDTAELSLPEIDLGIATFSGSNILEVIGGRALALDLIQSGRRMPAREACGRGLIGTVVQRGELEAAASLVAERLGSKNEVVFAENKQWINRSLKAALDEARGEHARHRAKPST